LLPYCARSPARSAAKGHAQIRRNAVCARQVQRLGSRRQRRTGV
jgi:hypothetical protein